MKFEHFTGKNGGGVTLRALISRRIGILQTMTALALIGHANAYEYVQHAQRTIPANTSGRQATTVPNLQPSRHIIRCTL
jgi:hypothetical protein